MPWWTKPASSSGYLHIKDVLETDEVRRNRPIEDKWVRPSTGPQPMTGCPTLSRSSSGAEPTWPGGRRRGPTLGVATLEDVIEELVGESGTPHTWSHRRRRRPGPSRRRVREPRGSPCWTGGPRGSSNAGRGLGGEGADGSGGRRGTRRRARVDRPQRHSSLRLLGVPLFLWLVLGPEADGWALGVLAASGVTDYLDGYLARRLTRPLDWARSSIPLPTGCTSWRW